ncbi:MAG: hypothetical protein GX800_08260, partial [Clostridiaceae bacterium]|nr:hypothetical protein [Clostridiaceae bacterium]
MRKKLGLCLLILALMLNMASPVFAADSKDVETERIFYGEKSNEQIIDKDVFNQLQHASTRSLLTYFDIYLTSIGYSSSFYVSTGRVRINYAQHSTSYGTITATLVN